MPNNANNSSPKVYIPILDKIYTISTIPSEYQNKPHKLRWSETKEYYYYEDGNT